MPSSELAGGGRGRAAHFSERPTLRPDLRPPAIAWHDIHSIGARSRAVCSQLRAGGTPVRFLRSVFVPEDGTCFLLLAGAERDSVQRAVTAAGLALEGVVATWSSTDPGEVHP